MTETVAEALTSVNCGSDAIMRAVLSIQLFGIHNGPVLSNSKNFLELGETAKTVLKNVQPLSCMLQTFHLQRLSPHVYSVLDILRKTESLGAVPRFFSSTILIQTLKGLLQMLRICIHYYMSE